MYCPKCGNQAPDQERYCPNCGAAMPREGEKTRERSKSGAGPNDVPGRKRKVPGRARAEGKDRTALMTAIAAVLAGTAVFLVLIWTDVIKLPFLKGNESGSVAVVSSSSESGASPAPSETPKVTSEPTQEATETPEPVPTVAIGEYTADDFEKISCAAAYLVLARESSESTADSFLPLDLGGEELEHFLASYLYGMDGLPEAGGINRGTPSDTGYELVYPRSSVERLLSSVFGRVPDYEFHSRSTWYEGDSLMQSRGDGAPVYDMRFLKSQISGQTVTVTGELMQYSNAGTDTEGVYRVKLAWDPDSLFSYHVVSIQRAEDPSGAFTSADASSMYVATDANTYFPSNVLDGNPATAWVEGVDGLGIGESITIYADSPQKVHGIRILEGYTKNPDIYDGNAVPWKFRLEFSDGTVIETNPDPAVFLEREDRGPYASKKYKDGSGLWEGQSVEALEGMTDFISFGREIETTYIHVTILAVDAGSSWEDTAISEIIPY